MASKVLAFDVGKHGGMAYEDSVLEVSEPFDFTTLNDYFKRVKAAIDLYKPDIVATAYPTRFYRVIVFQSKLAAIIELACEVKGVEFYEVQDSTVKKAVLGNGHAKKDEIMKFFNKTNEHEADAAMFCKYITNLLCQSENTRTESRTPTNRA